MKSAISKIRVLTAKPGLDGHDAGVLVVSKALKDAGMEVIYLGIHQTPEAIVEAALQEDVDVIGLSILSDAHMAISERMLDLLKERGAKNILLLVGGIYRAEDIPKLKKMGVDGAFPPDTPLDSIVDFVKTKVKK